MRDYVWYGHASNLCGMQVWPCLLECAILNAYENAGQLAEDARWLAANWSLKA